MEPTATESLTLELPASVIRTLRQTAELSGAPISAIVSESLHHALAPLDDVPAEQAAELAKLSLLDDAALWRIARSRLPRKQQHLLADLLDRQGSGALQPGDRERLADLLDVYGRATVKKAHAFLLLARRGYRVPVQAGSL